MILWLKKCSKDEFWGLFQRVGGLKETICGLRASFLLTESWNFRGRSTSPAAPRDPKGYKNHVVNYERKIILLWVVVSNLPFSCSKVLGIPLRNQGWLQWSPWNCVTGSSDLKTNLCPPAMNKMWIFIFWSDTRVAINCSSSLFSRWGVAEDWCCSFREMFSWWGKELFDGHQQFVSSFSGSKIQTRGWNKQPVNFPFTVVSWKWRTGILREPSKPGNKCTISCRKVLKAISAHLRIIMHFKPICWNINIIMGKEIHAQWEVSWRRHRVFCGTRWNEWNRGVFGEANDGDVVGKRR